MPVYATPDELKGAHDALASGDYARAASLYTNVLQGERLEAPMLADVYYERGVAEHQLGSLTHAISDYTNAIWLGALAPSFEAKVFLARGIAQLESNQINRAETDFDSAVAKDDTMADAYFARATVRRLQAEQDAAIADYNKAIALNHPAPQLVLFGRGLAYDALGKSVPAGQDFTKAAALDASFAPARARLVAMGLPIPAADPVAVSKPKIDPAAPIAMANIPGLEVALGIAPDDQNATASLSPRDSAPVATPGPDGVMDTIAETGTSHTAAPEGKTADAGSPFLRPPSDGLLGAKGEAPIPTKSDVEVASLTPSEMESTQAPAAASPAAAPPGPVAATPEVKAETPPADIAIAAPTPKTEAKIETPKAEAAIEAPKAAAPVPAVPAPAAVVKKDDTTQAVAGLPAATGTFYVQIAAFQQKELAEKGRLAFSDKFPEIVGQVPPSIMEANLGAKGTVYRLRLGPLETAEDSATLCQTLKKQGQACIVVPPARKAG